VHFKFTLAANNLNLGSLPQDASNNNFAITNVDGETSTTLNATTQFVTDADVVEATVNKPISISNVLYNSSITRNEEDIKSFLAKPRASYSGVFSSTDTVSTFTSFNVPSASITNTVVSNKLSGFYGIRMTTVFTLQVNANRFQQGRYMLCFTSTGGADPTSTAGSNWIRAHNNSLVQRTQLPRIEIDLACDTQAVLKIPWSSQFTLFPINNTSGVDYSIGQVQIFPYSALVAPTGSTTASFTLWVHYEDVELIGPANPQMASATEIEQKSQNIGPITSTLAKLSSAISLWNGVPLLSSYVKNASWFTDTLSKTTAIFGWSKPVNLSHAVRINRVPGIFSGNVDNADQALPLSLTVKNEVSILPGFSATDIDEMDFSYFATIPAWTNTSTWTTSQTIGSVVNSFSVGASNFNQQRTILGGIVATDFVPIGYVANLFNYWRGGITFTFKIVKTEFHSGRLAFAFYPHIINQTATDTLATSDYVHREILDIRDKNIFTITIPYIAESEYRACNQTNQGFTGTAALFVQDPLVAPASVSASITILMEVSGAPDIEFAFPSQANSLTPAFAVTPQMDMSPQPNGCQLVDTCIGGSSITHDNFANSAACIGERISSFRTYLKSASWMGPTATQGAATSYLNFLPYSIPSWYNSATTPSPSVSGDLYASLASCYAYSRGGVRVRAFFTGINSATRPQFAYQYAVLPTGYALPLQATGADFNTSSTIANKTLVNNVAFNYVQDLMIEVKTAQYELRHARANATCIVTPNINYVVGITSGAPKSGLSFFIPDTFTGYQIARSGADDLNFGQFISIPPMVVVSPAIL